MRRNALDHAAVGAELAPLLAVEEDALPVRQAPGAHPGASTPRLVHGTSQEVSNQADDLAVAVGSLRVVGEAGERGGRVEPGALRLHLGRLAPFRLRELRGDDDQAQVDHEERADLPHERKQRVPWTLRLAPGAYPGQIQF